MRTCSLPRCVSGSKHACCARAALGKRWEPIPPVLSSSHWSACVLGVHPDSAPFHLTSHVPLRFVEIDVHHDRREMLLEHAPSSSFLPVKFLIWKRRPCSIVASRFNEVIDDTSFAANIRTTSTCESRTFIDLMAREGRSPVFREYLTVLRLDPAELHLMLASIHGIGGMKRPSGPCYDEMKDVEYQKENEDCNALQRIMSLVWILVRADLFLAAIPDFHPSALFRTLRSLPHRSLHFCMRQWKEIEQSVTFQSSFLGSDVSIPFSFLLPSKTIDILSARGSIPCWFGTR